jgi:acyl-CoA synthetase (AMP-forming)/AMP-acid ligase II
MNPQVAAQTTVYRLVAMRATATPDAPAIKSSDLSYTYAELIERVDRVAADLAARGISRGDRIAVISENRVEYAVLQLSAAKLGIICACQNWRLAPKEAAYCVQLIDPSLVVASDRFRGYAEEAAGNIPIVAIDALDADGETTCVAEPEDGLFIIYTSGTTGLPKAAVISHRAQIARMSALRLDLGIHADEGYISWAPMFHIGGTEHLISTLMSGASGVVLDGFDADRIIDTLEVQPIGWLLLVPATIAPLIARLKERQPSIQSVRAVGCMADLVPRSEIEEISALLNAPFLNSFGATETGMAPLSGDLIWPGHKRKVLAKRLSILTELRLVGSDGVDIEDGDAGEAWMRGPTLFSGYWNNPDANTKDFANGWFHMGDMFRKTAHGYEFAGRSKYLIKTGGENVYPAEIERVLLADHRITDAIVVKKPDDRWGEVPVAVVASNTPDMNTEDVMEICRSEIAGYKCPKEVFFVTFEDLPRNVSGKILREEIEELVAN